MNTQSFNFENGLSIRVLSELKEETAWFIAKDICEILDISNTTQAVDRLDEDEKLISKIHISGQERDTWTINEFGLYSLILTSNKPEAKQFKRWITHEVLPTIRKAGKYSTDEMNEREENIQRIMLKIDNYENNIKQIKQTLSEENNLLKNAQKELKTILSTDRRQLKLKF